VVICLAAVASVLLMPKEPSQRLFPFYLPWDDSEETVVSISDWLDKPAGSLGHVYVGIDGHLYVGAKRIKFLGVNICAGGAFPEKEEAEKIAARLAKFGVNIVRFHHMDAAWEPFNIFDQSFGNTRHLNPEALDRLDYFVAKLKENGVYVDLNLLVSRGLTSADGLPNEIDAVEWKDQQVLGFFVDEINDLQKEYALQLLAHRNPYTNLTYAEDPAVAFVEIVNEEGLIQGWLGGVIDGFPEIFKETLGTKWNGYLTAKYGSTNNLGTDENSEQSSVPIFSLREFSSKPPEAREDWAEFLWQLEEEYFAETQRYLKDELDVKALVIGTIVGCSTPNMMAQLDVIDTHNYWYHPSFPTAAWDLSDWYVINEPLVNHLDEGTITGLALKRVYGKPHLVTEYNHPAPNMYDAETAITLAAYAALQDWDGIFLFDYGSRNNWDSEMIRGYFDVDQHPVKMATLITAHMIFVRGDVQAANEVVSARLTKQNEIDFIAAGRARAWNLIDGSYLDMPPAAALIHRTALVVDGSPIPTNGLTPQEVDTTGPVYSSDTGEVVWDSSSPYSGILRVNTPKSIAVVGFGGGKKHVFGAVTIEPHETLLGTWSVITLTVMDGQSFDDWNTLLLVATGYSINSRAEIREYVSGAVLAEGLTSLPGIRRFNNEITCANSWGEAPTLVEVIPATIRIETAQNIEVWALNNKGERDRQVPASVQGDIKSFVIGPEYATLWYEITAEQ
jgi:hypothetical protein